MSSTSSRTPARRPRVTGPAAPASTRRPSPRPHEDLDLRPRTPVPQAPSVVRRRPPSPAEPEVSASLAPVAPSRSQVRPRSSRAPAPAPGQEVNLRRLRGYGREDLMAIAEVGHHYLFSGGTQLALAIFEGLQAIDPGQAYFATALGLTHDHLGNPEEAERWYRRAAQLDPNDGRPDVNRAELRIVRRDYAKARELLIRGANKARASRDEPLLTKAKSMLKQLERVA